MGGAALGADATAAEPGDRFPVKSLGGLALAGSARERASTPNAQSVPPARVISESRSRASVACSAFAVADGRLDELDETEVVEPRILWMRAGPLGRA